MVRFLLLTIALVAFVSGSEGSAAADLPVRAAPSQPATAVPLLSWTGFYAGITSGYAFDTDDRVHTSNGRGLTTQPIFTRPYLLTVSDAGYTGGAEFGYNYQITRGSDLFGPGGIVAGVEADAAYMDLGKTRTVAYPTGNRQFHFSLDYLGTARGRLGYAFGPMLVFGSGGFAYSTLDYKNRYFNTAGDLAFSGQHEGMQTGYTLGGGLEYQLPTTSFLNVFKSSGVTLKGEYLHYNLGRITVRLPNTGIAGATGYYNARDGIKGDVVRLGLNFKFGSS